ncbi:MAG: guanylate kinase [Synechococcus sp. SB0672_bin_6]|nr:guanylate kinase [Synechococcus sp. SB0672_bin_6]
MADCTKCGEILLLHGNTNARSGHQSAVDAAVKSAEPTSRLLVLTGPSGVGKGTILQALLARYPQVWLSVSATTRPPRPGERHGENYFFLDRQTFMDQVARGEFLEWAEFAGHAYGTPAGPIQSRLRDSQTVVLEIEVEGARQVRRHLPTAVQVFLRPPSMAALEERIRARGSDSEDAITKRIARAREELARADEFDHVILNGDLNQAIADVDAILQSMLKPEPADRELAPPIKPQ